jgi:hypothetical protein
VPIYAMPYPLVITRKGCADSPLTNAEQAFLFEFTEILNDTLRAEAARAGINWVSEATTAHVGNRMCEPGDLSINLVDILPKEGPLSARIIPTHWVKGSSHPHEAGHRLTFNAVLPPFQGELSNPEPNEGASAEIAPTTQTISRGALGIPAALDCGSEDVRVSLTVRAAITESNPELVGISESSPVCMNSPNGGWGRWDSFDPTSRDASWNTDDALALSQDERAEFHVITYLTDTTWKAAVYQYCNLDEECVSTDDDLTAWMQRQIEATVRSSVVPALLVFAAWWFLFVWLKGHPDPDDGQPKVEA